MKNIVKIENEEAKVSLEDVALFSGVQKRAIIRTIRNNAESFSRFGNLRLAKESTNIGKLLNEAETTFLLTLLKNTPKVVKFKSDLVYQFYTMREFTCEINKKQLELKEEQLKLSQLQTEKAKRQIYAKPRGSKLETVVRVIKNNQINITPYDINKILVESGMLSVKKIEVNKYTSLNMDGETPLVHEETVIKICDSLDIKRGGGYYDEHPTLF